MTRETLDRARRLLGAHHLPTCQDDLAACHLFCDGADPLAFSNFLVPSDLTQPCRPVLGKRQTDFLLPTLSTVTCVSSPVTFLSGAWYWRGLLKNDIDSLHIMLPKALGQSRKCLS